MKGNKEYILTKDFLKTWFNAFKRTPLVMIKITLFAVVVLVAIAISSWFTRNMRELDEDEDGDVN